MTPKDTEMTPTLSTTVLLVRDIKDAFEIFMVARHPKSNFASGALVFPGGKLDPQDRDPALLASCQGQKEGQNLNDEELALRICGIRETFEEAGVLLARDNASGEMVAGAQNAHIVGTYREALHQGEVSLLEIMQQEKLTLACDQMTLFARWVTPTFFPRRFDTYFFLAEVSEEQVASHDDIESTDSLWTTPAAAIADGDAGRKTVVFATRANLRKLAQFNSVADLTQNSLSEEIKTVEPVVTDNKGDVTFRIREDAGYPLTEHTEYGGALLKVKPKS